MKQMIEILALHPEDAFTEYPEIIKAGDTVTLCEPRQKSTVTAHAHGRRWWAGHVRLREGHKIYLRAFAYKAL